MHKTAYEIIHNLTDETVGNLCESIIKSLEDPPTTYTEEASEFWNGIINNVPFDWNERVIKELKILEKNKIIDVADKWLFCDETKKKVSFMFFGNKHYEELNDFKKTIFNNSNMIENIDNNNDFENNNSNINNNIENNNTNNNNNSNNNNNIENNNYNSGKIKIVEKTKYCFDLKALENLRNDLSFLDL
jgi:hypothetical protein